MLKQFASLKNCRCTWQLTWQIYVYEADTIEINRNINMVLRFWKYMEIYWYDLICFAMVNYVSLAACCCTQNMLVGLNLHENQRAIQWSRALANWKELGVCSKTRWSMMVNQFEDVNSLSRVAAVASLCFVPPDGRQGSSQFMRSFEHSASLSSTKSKV